MIRHIVMFSAKSPENIDAIYQGVEKVWQNYVFSDKVNTKICKALHGDSSGVRGAAWLWPEA